MRRATCCCRRSFMTAQVRRDTHTFFGTGIAAHITFAEPISAKLRNLLADSARSLGVTVHNGGTYVNMDGPAFSTRAESEFNHRNGFDVIGDDEFAGGETGPRSGDRFRDDGDDYRLRLLEGGRGTGLGRNRIQPFDGECRNGEENNCGCNSTDPDRAELAGAFRPNTALVTDRKLWPQTTIEKLKPILERFLVD